jgi:hypothetical protein
VCAPASLDFALRRALAAARRADRPAQLRRKARRRLTGRTAPARPPIADGDDDEPLFASRARKRTSPRESGRGDGAGGRLPLEDPPQGSSVLTEGSAGSLREAAQPASPGTGGSDSGPVRRVRRAGAAAARRRVLQSGSDSAEDAGPLDRPAPVELGSSSDCDGSSDDSSARQVASGPSRRGRRASPWRSGAARLDGLSEDDEAEEGESESAILASVPPEIVREYRRLKRNRALRKADFSGIGVKRLGFYRLLFRRFLAHPLCRRLDLKVRCRTPAPDRADFSRWCHRSHSASPPPPQGSPLGYSGCKLVATKLFGRLSARDQQMVWLDLALTGITARGAAVLLQAIHNCERLEESLYLDLQVKRET